MNYVQINIDVKGDDLQEIIIAILADNNYDGFETDENIVRAFIDEENYNETELKALLNNFQLSFTKNTIEKQNWNELWESNFSPVVVDNFVGVRAHFHSPLNNVEHEIIITPKMSFGTGHHATTFLVMQLMQEIDFVNKTVFDFGTGTGILAIFAEKLQAKKLLAVDNDDWCIENSIENIENNNCTNITVCKADNAKTEESFDIIIANINKNIILENLEFLNFGAKKNAKIILSGLLIDDEKSILQATNNYDWQHKKRVDKNGWIAILFEKN